MVSPSPPCGPVNLLLGRLFGAAVRLGLPSGLSGLALGLTGAAAAKNQQAVDHGLGGGTPKRSNPGTTRTWPRLGGGGPQGPSLNPGAYKWGDKWGDKEAVTALDQNANQPPSH